MNSNDKYKIKVAAVCFIISILIFFINKVITIQSNNSNLLNNLVLNIGEIYYEEVFYKSFGNNDDLLKNYENKGITIDIDTAILNINYKIDNNKIKKCNLSNSYIYIYPKSPYKINNYEIKTKLSC